MDGWVTHGPGSGGGMRQGLRMGGASGLGQTGFLWNPRLPRGHRAYDGGICNGQEGETMERHERQISPFPRCNAAIPCALEGQYTDPRLIRSPGYGPEALGSLQPHVPINLRAPKGLGPRPFAVQYSAFWVWGEGSTRIVRAPRHIFEQLLREMVYRERSCRWYLVGSEALPFPLIGSG